MNEVYTGKRNSDRRKKKNYLGSRIGKHILKQFSAVLVCTALAVGMKLLPVAELNEYSSALGRAVRHETDIKMFEDFYENIKDVIGISGETEKNDTGEEH